MHKLFDLTGKVAVVTGCAHDIGRAMAEGVAQAGANVIGIDGENMSETKKNIEALGRSFEAIQTDITDFKQLPSLVDDIVNKYGKIDILINCESIKGPQKIIEELSWEDYDRVIDVNQNALVKLTLEVYKVMKKQGGGKIVIVSSVLATRTNETNLAYSTSKSAIIGFTRALAVAGARHKIWVNAVAPGVIATEKVLKEGKIEQLLNEMIEQRLPAKRPGKPEELKGIAVFLSSEASDFIVGQVIAVDGGFLTRN